MNPEELIARALAEDTGSRDQISLVRDVDCTGLYLVAKVSCAEVYSTRASDLAGDVVVAFGNPGA